MAVIGTVVVAAASAHHRPCRAGRPATTVLRSRLNHHLGMRIVVNSSGHTLYFWSDSPRGYGSAQDNKSFPPLIAHGRVVAAQGSKINGHKLGTRKLSNGQRQVTYFGGPLYLYTGDHKPGQIDGERHRQDNGSWDAVLTIGHVAVPIY